MKKIEKVLSDKKDIIYIGNHKQPKIIYKYRNWLDCYNQNVIKNNELYLSSPKDFNDPFDCKITPNYYQLDSKEKIMKYALIVIERNKQYLNSIGLNLNDEALKIYNRFVADPAKEQIILNKISIEIQDKFYGVLSMSCIWNSILMWSHYSDKHKGYCIGFHEEKLRESGSFGKGGKVKYDKYPEIDLLEKDLMKISFIETHYKAKEWSYEKEYRLSTTFDTELPVENQVRKVHFDDSFVAEIIIGMETPKDIEDEIIDIAKNKNIKIFKTCPTPFKFKMNRYNLLEKIHS